MKLVKTKTKKGERTCGIDESKNGGEYTFCAIAVDSSIEFEDCEWTDKKPAKKITCMSCIKIIKYYQSLKI